MSKDESEKGLQRLKRTLERWRADGRPGKKIPDQLWSEAIVLAKNFGVGTVARTAKLDHGKLKKLLEEGQGEAMMVPMEQPPTFVEFLAAPLPRAISCVIEVESARGRMRADVSGLDAVGLSTLCREFGNL